MQNPQATAELGWGGGGVLLSSYLSSCCWIQVTVYLFDCFRWLSLPHSQKQTTPGCFAVPGETEPHCGPSGVITRSYVSLVRSPAQTAASNGLFGVEHKEGVGTDSPPGPPPPAPRFTLQLSPGNSNQECSERHLHIPLCCPGLQCTWPQPFQDSLSLCQRAFSTFISSSKHLKL